MKMLNKNLFYKIVKNTALTLSYIIGSEFIIIFDGFAAVGSYSIVSSNISSNTLTDVMCNVLRIATGNAGKAFAAFAIISVGIGFFTGKVSWGLMVGVAAGIAAMFGAPQIVSAISGKSAATCI